jgi:hypothetical protein
MTLLIILEMSSKKNSNKQKRTQQSVHLTLGTAALEGGVRTSQAVFYALSFFWLDGFAVPALVVELVETQRRALRSHSLGDGGAIPLRGTNPLGSKV